MLDKVNKEDKTVNSKVKSSELIVQISRSPFFRAALWVMDLMDEMDKSNQAEYYHPINVALSLPDTVPDHWKIAAVLHDILEDTDKTIEDFRHRGSGKEITDIVEALTKDEKKYGAKKKEKGLKKELNNLEKGNGKKDKIDSDGEGKIKELKKEIKELKHKRYNKYIDEEIIGHKDKEVAIAAAIIKLADMNNNLSSERISRLKDPLADEEKKQKYLPASKKLIEFLQKQEKKNNLPEGFNLDKYLKTLDNLQIGGKGK